MPASSVGAVTRLRRDLTLYTLARLGLVAAVTAVLVIFGVPLLVSLAVAFVVGLPLGILVFRSLNQRVTAGLAERGAQREAHRAELRARLRGDEPPPEGP